MNDTTNTISVTIDVSETTGPEGIIRVIDVAKRVVTSLAQVRDDVPDWVSARLDTVSTYAFRAFQDAERFGEDPFNREATLSRLQMMNQVQEISGILDAVVDVIAPLDIAMYEGATVDEAGKFVFEVNPETAKFLFAAISVEESETGVVEAVINFTGGLPAKTKRIPVVVSDETFRIVQEATEDGELPVYGLHFPSVTGHAEASAFYELFTALDLL